MTMNTHMRLGTIEWATIAIVVIGALNWGLVGIGGFIAMNLNLVNLLFGSIPTLEYAIYVIVGLAGLYLAVVGGRAFRARSVEPTTHGEEAKPAS